MVEGKFFRLYAVFFSVCRTVQQFCGIEQRFGGNTTLVETYAADFAFFDDEDGKSVLRRAFAREIPRRTAAKYDQIKHKSSLQRRKRNTEVLERSAKLRKEPRGRRPVQRSVVVGQ